LEAELKKQTQGPPVDFSNGMINIIKKLEGFFSEAIRRSFPDGQPLPNAAITIGQNVKFGDYQCNSAMAISGVRKDFHFTVT